MDGITLKQLRYFEAVAQMGHFGQAADICAISQPAISVQIKELESTLGTTLFERTSRQVRLTPFGEVFALRARAILRRVDDLGDLARAAQDGVVGKLRLGVIPTIGPYLLPQVMAALAAKYPDLDVYVKETQTEKLLADLIAGRLDTAILALPVSEPALTETPLFSEKFVLIRHNADAGKPVPDAASLREMQLLLLEEGHCFRDQALSFCGLRSTVARAGMEGSSLSTLVQMVGTGIGVTLIPEMAIGVETKSAPVAISRFAVPQPERIIGMVWRKTSPMVGQLAQIAAVVESCGTPRGG